MDRFFLHSDFDYKIPVGSLPLCEVLLEPNAHYPWLILVPRVANASRLLDLNGAQTDQLWIEVRAAQEFAWTLQPLTQLNVGQLGNRCPQLHLHVVGRLVGDPAWPNPVWGHPASKSYTADQLDSLLRSLQAALLTRFPRFIAAPLEIVPCPPLS